ncbi:MAG: hypothetical protein IT380_23170 [Myxococcales bacterium]|nr:hypothetical protein [Myxococcales bacterium]
MDSQRSLEVCVGLDVGSTTVKAAAVAGGAVTFRAYRRHRGRVVEEALAAVEDARRAVGPAAVVVTGSAGAPIAERLGAEFVHEVHAVATAARAAVPGVRTIIELGGQDAKLLHLDAAGGLSTDMNERCAAGTGTVIDRIAFRLGVDEAALASLAVKDGPLPVVSARCGVFAETDVVALVKAGHPAKQVLAALLDAIVRQNLVALARGRPLPGPVCLLGGPNAFIPALAAAWRRHLEARWREYGVEPGAVVVPADAALFAAVGATLSREALEDIAQARGRRARLRTVTTPSPPPDDTGWLGATASAPVAAPRRTARAQPGAALVVGLDAGSTTVKAVALDACDAVVASAYRASTGNVFTDAAAVLKELHAQVQGADVQALGVTGYAGDLLGPVLGADCAEVETLAHARAARRFAPRADVVCDVGGQDIKVLMLDALGVRSFRLSHQCAAGNGALLASTAAALGVPLEQLAEVTERALRVPRFSVGCAVFLDTERVTAQRDGLSPSDILAGMTNVLPRNIWENVVGETSLEALGTVFVLSGGVQRNRAAVAAQAHYLRQRHPRVEVVVHPWAGEAGAIGAALAAREARPAGTRGRFIGLEAATALQVSAVSSDDTRCRLCPSHCARTVVSARRGDEVRAVVTGNACERGGLVPSVEALAAVDSGAVDSGAVDSGAGDSRAGDSRAGDSRAGDSRAGDSGAGDSRAGDSRAGDSRAGDSRAGDSGAGDSGAGDSRAGDSRAGDSGAVPATIPGDGESAEGAGGRASRASASSSGGGAAEPTTAGPRVPRGVNLVRLEATRLFRRHRAVQVVSSAGRGLRIAIPRVLAQYRAAPLFTHYFEALGVAREDLVLGEFTSEALWRRAAGRGTADACYPAKVAQAHVADLLARRAERPFDILFFPAVTHAVTSIKGCADTASCPVVAGTPLVTKVAFGADATGLLPEGVRLLTPALVLPRKRALSEALFESMCSVMPALTRGEHDAALAEGIAGQRAWDRRLEELGFSVLTAAKREGRCAVVLIGRPYHADPGLHHELGSELSALGRSALTLRALPHSEDLVAAAGCGNPHDASDLPFLTNSGDGERMSAARFVGWHPALVAVELSSFKCGQDASLYGHVAAAARGRDGKPFLALHDLDETRPVASLRLRLRTFLDAVERWERGAGARVSPAPAHVTRAESGTAAWTGTGGSERPATAPPAPGREGA